MHRENEQYKYYHVSHPDIKSTTERTIETIFHISTFSILSSNYGTQNVNYTQFKKINESSLSTEDSNF
jgi:hypothetical protein